MVDSTETVTTRSVSSDEAFLARSEQPNVERNPLTEIPVIDFSPFVQGGSRAAREAVARQVRAACIDIGFFYMVGHGIDQAEIDGVIEWGHAFFGLPLEVKMALHRNNDPTQSNGYMPSGGTEASSADLKENFAMSREVDPGEPAEGRYAAGRSQWPDPGVLPGFEDAMKAHIEKRTALGQVTAKAFALSLGLPETYFDDSFRHPGCNLVYNYYPPLQTGRIERTQWSIAPHADYGAFTMLAQDSNNGLQIRNSAGEWIEARPIPGAFVINIGDTMARWTNDLYASSLHRAANYNSGIRVSVPFFVFPNGRTEIRCLETCHGPDNPPRYEPILAQDYMLEMLSRYFRMGRPSISPENIERLRSQAGIP